MRILLYFLISHCLLIGQARADESETRGLLVELVTSARSEQEGILEKLANKGEPVIGEMYAAWRGGRIFTSATNEHSVYIQSEDGAVANLIDGQAVALPADAEKNRASRKIRKVMKRIVDLLDLSSPDSKKRIRAAEKLGLSQNADYLVDLKAKLEFQEDAKVRQAFQQAIFISELKNGNQEEQLAAVSGLGEMKSLPARDYIQGILDEERAAETLTDALKGACEAALEKIDTHQSYLEVVNTILRGLSTGSVLLLVSYGLAITFGLMGVINMAHGEFIAIGGYTVYQVQNMFAASFGAGSAMYGWYFAVSLPIAFIVAAIGGVVLERGLIRFLYKRPLESLLATWGVSMVLQQGFRLMFGAANVSVSSPKWLAGSYELAGFSMSYNRLLVIGFACFVIVATWTLLNKTNWGLHVRATMQNRQMASCLGVPSQRINMLTFAFGSGLAGLAGAFISQIGNVGPEMGQTYIVDSFMVVVVGGVGNLLGAALSSLGIGLTDQALQPVLGPVMGKISVLFAIILFLQFRPGGLFPSRTRSLDD